MQGASDAYISDPALAEPQTLSVHAFLLNGWSSDIIYQASLSVLVRFRSRRLLQEK